MTDEKANSIIKLLEEHNKILDALVTTATRQCGFQKQTLDALVLIGLQLVDDSSGETVSDKLTTIQDEIVKHREKINKIEQHVESLAGEFDPVSTNNFVALICDMAADFEKLTETLVGTEEETDIIRSHVSDDGPQMPE